MKPIKTLLLALLLTASQAYAGEFGNHCTTGLSMERVHQTDCAVNTVFEGKTYCFGNQEAQATFQKDPKTIIAKAQAFYATLPEPEREKLTQAQADAIIASKQCDLSNKELGYLQLDKADLRHCTMVNTSFFGAYLRGANLSGANMQRAYLNLARLEGTNLSGADLSDAVIFQAIFDKTNFRGANLSNARMIGTLGAVDISEATVKNGRFGLDVGNQPMGQMKFDSVGGKFANTNFEGADLNIAAFRFADLRGANLRNTNLYRADLIRADLTGADLTGADLRDAEVDGAIFKDVKGLDTVKHLDTVKGQCKDCMPSVAEAAEPVHAATAKQARLCMQQHGQP